MTSPAPGRPVPAGCRRGPTLSTGGIETTSYRARRMGSASMFSWVRPMGKARTVCRLGGKRSRSLSMAVARPAMPAGGREGSALPQAALRVWRQAHHHSTADRGMQGQCTMKGRPSQAELSKLWESVDRGARQGRAVTGGPTLRTCEACWACCDDVVHTMRLPSEAAVCQINEHRSTCMQASPDWMVWPGCCLTRNSAQVCSSM